MKIITFIGGLGNQIFEYAYLQWLKNKFPGERFYGFFPKAGLTGHNGFELDKRFDVKLPPTSFFSNAIAYILFCAIKIFKQLNYPCPFTSTIQYRNDKAIFHCDYWQDRQFILEDFCLKFKSFKINRKNASLIERINNWNSVSVHIRRGDYLKHKELYGGICTDYYYDEAIKKIQNNVRSPYYIFFSDDPMWVKQHFNLPNMEIVDWNTGENSFIDMYLMSQCDYMILANSTFSYWAARFNKKAKKVFCPIKWQNGNPVDITLSEWIEVGS